MILCFLEIHAEFAIQQKDRLERLVQWGRVAADTDREQVKKQIDMELGCIGQYKYLAAFSDEEFGDDMGQIFDRVSKRLEKSIVLQAATPISGRG